MKGNHRYINRAIAFTLACVMMITAAFSVNIFAADTDTSLKTVRVGYISYPGYEEGKDGQYKSGWGYEYLQTISYHTGWKYEYVYGSFSELLEMLEQGEIDLLGNVTYKDERAELINYSEYEQGTEAYYIYVASDNADQLQDDISELNGYNIAVLRGSYQYELLQEYLEQNGIGAGIIEYDSMEDVADIISSGECDAAVLTDGAEIGGQGLKAVCSLGFSSYYFAVAKERTDLLEELNEALYQIYSANPNYNYELHAKYRSSVRADELTVTSDESDWIEQHNGVITVGYLADSMPYIDVNSSDMSQVTGVMTKVEEILEEYFCEEVTYKMYTNYKDMSYALIDGDVDVIFPLYGDYWHAEQYNMIVSDALLTPTMIMIYNPNQSGSKTRTIAVSKGNAIQYGYAATNYPDSQLKYYADEDACLEAIKKGEVTCTFLTSHRLNSVNIARKMEGLKKVELGSINICFFTMKQDVAFATLLNKVISVASSEVNGIALTEYTSVSETMSATDFVTKYWIFVLAVIVVIAVLLYILTHQLYEKDRLKELSETDPLTGINNRGAGEAAIKKYIKNHQKGILYVIDADKFKEINDRYGHIVGDRVLQALAQGLKDNFRDGDIIMRLGGDEFAAFALGVEDLYIAKAVMERYFETIRSVKISGLPEGAIVVSCGLALYDGNGQETFDDLYKKADANLYKSKSLGGATITT